MNAAVAAPFSSDLEVEYTRFTLFLFSFPGFKIISNETDPWKIRSRRLKSYLNENDSRKTGEEEKGGPTEAKQYCCASKP